MRLKERRTWFKILEKRKNELPTYVKTMFDKLGQHEGKNRLIANMFECLLFLV